MRAYRKVDDHFEIRVDTSRLTLLGVGAALVLLLVFLLGVLVGKNVWGVRRTTLAPVAQAPRAATPPAVEPAPEADRPRRELTFYEDLKRPDRSEEEPLPVAKPRERVGGETPIPARESAPATAPAAAVESAPAREPVPDRRTAAGVEREAKPAAPAQRLPAPVFTIQVGSFRDRQAAAELAAKMAGQGVNASVVEVAVAGRTWYRVQVGRFQARADAENHYRTRLRPRGVQGFVTTR